MVMLAAPVYLALIPVTCDYPDVDYHVALS